MNFDMKKYQELGLNELGMNEEQAKAYRARLIVSTRGWHDSAPVDPDAERVRVGIVYNPITRRYAADYHTEGLEFGSRDELGDALLDCDDLSEPDPDKLISYPEPTTSEDEEEADKKLKTKKLKTKKHPSASTASAVPPPPRASEDEKADKKRKRTKKTKKKKIQATNLEEPKDNTSSPTTMRSDLIETLADNNLDPSASTAPEDEKADKKRTKKTKKKKKKKKIQATNLEEPKGNTSSPTRSKSIETLAEENLDPVMHPSDAQFEQRMNQIFGIALRCDNCRPFLEDLLASGTMTEAEGRSILENLIKSTFVENLDQSTAPVNN